MMIDILRNNYEVVTVEEGEAIKYQIEGVTFLTQIEFMKQQFGASTDYESLMGKVQNTGLGILIDDLKSKNLIT